MRRIVLRFLFYIHRNIKDDKSDTVINDWMNGRKQFPVAK